MCVGASHTRSHTFDFCQHFLLGSFFFVVVVVFSFFLCCCFYYYNIKSNPQKKTRFVVIVRAVVVAAVLCALVSVLNVFIWLWTRFISSSIRMEMKIETQSQQLLWFWFCKFNVIAVDLVAALFSSASSHTWFLLFSMQASESLPYGV